jgi:hypothetical protein
MVAEAILSFRIGMARSYIEALDFLSTLDWIGAHDRYLARSLPYPSAMALLHPWNYEGCPVAFDPRGPRTFGIEPGQGSAGCAAVLLWGYACPRSADPGVTADHLFPYALGGATVPENKYLLCRLHNQMKSCDVHLFPWEHEEPPWVALVLSRIRRWKEMNRLHFPTGNS